VPKAIEDRAPGGVGDGVEDIGASSWSRHYVGWVTFRLPIL
jgi:hypothetical protein